MTDDLLILLISVATFFGGAIIGWQRKWLAFFGACIVVGLIVAYSYAAADSAPLTGAFGKVALFFWSIINLVIFAFGCLLGLAMRWASASTRNETSHDHRP